MTSNAWYTTDNSLSCVVDILEQILNAFEHAWALAPKSSNIIWNCSYCLIVPKKNPLKYIRNSFKFYQLFYSLHIMFL